MTRTRLFVASVCLLLSMSAQAQVYEWRDAEGRVMYSDRPPPGVDARLVRSGARAAPPAPEAAPEADRPKTLADQALEFRRRRESAAAEEAERKQKADQQAEIDAACQQTRNHLAALESGARISRFNSAGEREFLSDADRQTEIQRAREQLKQHCEQQ